MQLLCQWKNCVNQMDCMFFIISNGGVGYKCIIILSDVMLFLVF